MDLMAMALDAAARASLMWNAWNVHIFVLFSLCLQMFLFFSAPLRKKSTFVVLVVSVWSAYQLVDIVIFRALALISSAKNLPEGNAEFVDLYNFWIAFMVLHFGGTDTITALAIEDNNLWMRNYLNFISLLIIIVNAVVSVPKANREIKLFIAISCFLILFAGFVKSLERVISLSRASFSIFEKFLVRSKPNLGADYAAIVEELEQHKEAGVPVKPYYLQGRGTRAANAHGNINEVSGLITKLSDAQVIAEAYRLFKKFRGTYVNMVYCCHDRNESRELFMSLLPEDGFKIAETEMKFAYEAFYTKMPALSVTAIFLWFPFSLEIIAMILWSLEYKIQMRSIDVIVTWCLLFGAIVIDATSILRLYCSDWVMARPGNTLVQQFPLPATLLLFLRRRRWGKYKGLGRNNTRRSLCKLLNSWTESVSLFTLHTLFGDWSESISQLNFINYCIDERSKCGNGLYGFLGAKDMMDGWRYVTRVALTNDLRKLIFYRIKMRSVFAEDLDCWEEASSSRGSWFLHCNPGKHPKPAAYERWILDVEYDESLLIWHIATELCFQAEEEPEDDVDRGHRRFSKILSDYMLYLLLRQPKLMTEIAPMAEVIFKDTAAEARQFFHEEMPASSCLPNAIKCKTTTDRVQKKACVRIMQVTPNLAAEATAENNSVLFDACELANRLMQDNKSSRWEFISQMWVELLCYAAGHSPGNVHAAQLTAGGELLTLVRLLMLHFGLSNQFRKAKFCRRGGLLLPILLR